MRKIAIFATSLLVAACSGGDADETGESAEFRSANGSAPGTYEVSSGEGDTSIVTIYPDGTYSQVTPEGTNPAQGQLEVVDGQTCFRVDRPGAVALCYTESEPGVDGSYTATTDSGLELTVRPYEAPPEADAAAQIAEEPAA